MTREERMLAVATIWWRSAAEQVAIKDASKNPVAAPTGQTNS